MYCASDCSLAAAAESSPRRSRAWSRSWRVCAASSSISASRARSCSVSNCSKPSRACAGIALSFEVVAVGRQMLRFRFAARVSRPRRLRSASWRACTRSPISESSDSMRCRTSPPPSDAVLPASPPSRMRVPLSAPPPRAAGGAPPAIPAPRQSAVPVACALASRPAISPCLRAMMASCSCAPPQGAAIRARATSSARRTRDISASSCCSRWPEVIACCLGLALLAFETIEQGSKLFNFAAQREHSISSSRKRALQIFQLAQHIAQFALHGKRPFGALFAAGDGDVVKAFPGLREEKRIRIFQRQSPRHVRIGHDVAIAQLRQNHFQRLAKAIQHADRVLQRHNLSRRRSAVRGFIQHERKLRLRIFRMHQEGRAAIDIAAQQAQTFIRRVPRFHHDVVQFVAQKVFHDALVARLDLQKVSQHADGCQPALHHARLKQPAHRFGRISVLGDDRFQRSLFTQRRRKFRAQHIEMRFGFQFPASLLRFDQPPKLARSLP